MSSSSTLATTTAGEVIPTSTSLSVATSTSEPSTTVPARTSTPVASADVRALDVFAAFIPVQNEQQAGYVWDRFGYPQDADGDGCDTRDEVLIEEATGGLRVGTAGGGCNVANGVWFSPYDAESHTQPSSLEIDHVVSLKEAHDSGAWSWEDGRRSALANDLSYLRSLRVVTSATNTVKGDADPSNWLPPKAASCASTSPTGLRSKHAGGSRWTSPSTAVSGTCSRTDAPTNGSCRGPTSRLHRLSPHPLLSRRRHHPLRPHHRRRRLCQNRRRSSPPSRYRPNPPATAIRPIRVSASHPALRTSTAATSPSDGSKGRPRTLTGSTATMTTAWAVRAAERRVARHRRRGRQRLVP